MTSSQFESRSTEFALIGTVCAILNVAWCAKCTDFSERDFLLLSTAKYVVYRFVSLSPLCHWGSELMWDQGGAQISPRDGVLLRGHIWAYPDLPMVSIFNLTHPCCLQCFDAVGWAAGRASGL